MSKPGRLFLQDHTATANPAPLFGYFRLRDDIQSNLLTIYQTMQSIANAAKPKSRPAAYQQGFEMAARAVALAFKLNLTG